MTSGQRRRERGGGAVTVPVAATLLVIFAVIGLAVDGVRKAQAIASADAIAQEAARAGGQAVRPGALVGGMVELDPAAAAAAAQQYLADAGVTGRVSVLGPDRIRVEVTTSQPTVLLSMVGVENITAEGSAEALLVPTPAGAGP